jgi:hypothetical protein
LSTAGLVIDLEVAVEVDETAGRREDSQEYLEQEVLLAPV